jgi:hypothetical protein
MMAHGSSLPFVILLATPDQRSSDHVVAIPKDVGPHVDGLSNNALDGKASIVEARINVLNVKRAAGSRASNRSG